MKLNKLSFLMAILISVVVIACAQPKQAPKACTMEYNPQCGTDGITYGNPCMAEGKEIAHPGECQNIAEDNTIPLEESNPGLPPEGNVEELPIEGEIQNNPAAGSDVEIPADCVSWFDGCNNCGVENGKLTVCTMMFCETPGIPKCNEYMK